MIHIKSHVDYEKMQAMKLQENISIRKLRNVAHKHDQISSVCYEKLVTRRYSCFEILKGTVDVPKTQTAKSNMLSFVNGICVHYFSVQKESPAILS